MIAGPTVQSDFAQERKVEVTLPESCVLRPSPGPFFGGAGCFDRETLWKPCCATSLVSRRGNSKDMLAAYATTVVATTVAKHFGKDVFDYNRENYQFDQELQHALWVRWSVCARVASP